MKKPTIPDMTEHQHQVCLFQWAALNVTRYPDLAWLYAVPNGARTSMSTAKKLKAEGLKAGYPDIGLDVARGGFFGLRIELKRTKNPRMSGVQQLWLERLTDQGYFSQVAYGWKPAVRILEDYLKLAPTLEGRQMQTMTTAEYYEGA